MFFVLTLGIFFASLPVYYAWLVNFVGPNLDPATVRTNLEAIGITIDLYATYELSLSVASAMVYSVVSATIFWRRSDNWLALLTSLGLLTFGVFFSTDGPNALAEQYPEVWLPVNLLAFFGSISFILFFYLFPNGQFVPRWTRWILIVWTTHEIAYYFFPDSIFNINRSLPLLDFVASSSFLLIGVGSQIYRYRHVSGTVQRQQTKWVVFGMVSATLGAFGFALPLKISPTLAQFATPYALALEAVAQGFLLLIPLSIGVAVLRHRLWDIDILINRTLVYGVLTSCLALVYVFSVVTLQEVFRTLASQESDLATIASTLMVAILFRPLRRRVQGFIDRRFCRRKYNATQILAAFSARLRDEVNLDNLIDDLVEVVQETFQPSHVSLWLRSPRKKPRHSNIRQPSGTRAPASSK